MNVFKKSQETLDNRNYQLRTTLDEWSKLKNARKIEELEIKQYEFEPMYHYSILNEKYFHMGLFRMVQNAPNALLSSYTFLKTEDATKGILADFTDCFNQIFDNFSTGV